MTTTIREHVLAALRNNPGLNNALLANMIGMTTKKISGTISSLLGDGLIASEGKHGQRLYRLTSYGIGYAPETLPDFQQGKSRLVQRTEANVICEWEAYDAMSGCQQAAHRAKLCWAAMVKASQKLREY